MYKSKRFTKDLEAQKLAEAIKMQIVCQDHEDDHALKKKCSMRIKQAREENQIQFLENLFRILKFSPAITTNQVKLKSAKFIKDEVYDIFYQKRKSSKNRLLEKRLEENYISNPEKVDDEEALQRQCREKIIFTIEMIKNCIFSQNVVIEIKIILAKTFEIIASNYPSIWQDFIPYTLEVMQ
ncbi:unnamed protein product [Moneuplotes crassus]|uniref:Uncharacterized protein n=1 Tax=Euplotes crassus TaxID=5936 RepID=A0AAD1X6D1_EUPCR|nr:unnamed protein product [Moneuplotes crassus]